MISVLSFMEQFVDRCLEESSRRKYGASNIGTVSRELFDASMRVLD